MEWKPVVGYEGWYEVSDTGIVRSLPRETNHERFGTMHPKGKVLTQHPDKRGYLTVTLCRNGSRKTSLVHRLVAEAFIPNPDNLDTVNHKNEVREDNCVDNLEWLSRYDNMMYGTCIERRTEKRKKEVIAVFPDGREMKFDSLKEAGNYFNGSYTSISAVLHGRLAAAFGCQWKFAKEEHAYN
jgi:hypothetical protein